MAASLVGAGLVAGVLKRSSRPMGYALAKIAGIKLCRAYRRHYERNS